MLKNEKYTLAMARTQDLHSATSQFFINLNDNFFLNHRDKSKSGYGYTVFGKVIDGLEFIETLQNLKTITDGTFADVPAEDIIIKKAVILSTSDQSKKSKDDSSDTVAKSKK